MPAYTYLARDAATGRELRNSLDAPTEEAAIAALLNRNLLVLSIEEKTSKKGKSAGGSVPLSDLVVFTRQVATMIDAGLAMVHSLQALAEAAQQASASAPQPDVESAGDESAESGEPKQAKGKVADAEVVD